MAARDLQAILLELPGPPRLLAMHPQTLDELFAAFLELPRATNTLPQAQRLLAGWQARCAEVRCAAVRSRSAQRDHSPRTLILEWVDPPFNAGHWTPQRVDGAGGQSVSGIPEQPSRRLDWSEISQADPEVLVVACCGLDLSRSRQELPLLRQAPRFTDWSCTRRGERYPDGRQHLVQPVRTPPQRPTRGPRPHPASHTLHPTVHPAPPEASLVERFPAAAETP